MTSQLSNPFLKKTKFQYLYSSVPHSISSPYLIGPQTSICPKKKYSKNDWYEYKSSQLQLSQKILYRMNAQFHKLQSMNNRDTQLNCNRNCLLNTQLKKNPFHKGSLLHEDVFNTVRNYKNEKDWTEQYTNSKFRDVQSRRNYTQQVKQYGQLKKKVQSIKSIKSEQNPQFLALKSASKLTFSPGYRQKMIENNSGYQKEIDSWKRIDTNRDSKQQFENNEGVQFLKNIDEKKIQIKISQSLKKSQSDTFTLKRESTQKQIFPSKIKYKNITYYFVPS